MPYTPPAGNSVGIAFQSGYGAPPGSSVTLQFEVLGDIQAGLRDQSLFGTAKVTQQQVIRASSWLSEAFPYPDFDRTSPHIDPVGFSSLAMGAPTASWRQFITPQSLTVIESFYSVERVWLAGGYQSPPGGSITVEFDDDAYSPPPASTVVLEFGALGFGKVLSASAGNQLAFGTPLMVQPDTLKPSGFDALSSGTPTVASTNQSVFPGGLVQTVFGSQTIFHKPVPRYLTPSGYDAAAYGTALLGTGGAIYLRGDDYLNFGIPEIADPIYECIPWWWPKVYGAGAIPAQGIGSSSIALANPAQRAIAPPSLVATTYGEAFAQNLKREIKPWGFRSQNFDTPTILTWRESRYVDAEGDFWGFARDANITHTQSWPVHEQYKADDSNPTWLQYISEFTPATPVGVGREAYTPDQIPGAGGGPYGDFDWNEIFKRGMRDLGIDPSQPDSARQSPNVDRQQVYGWTQAFSGPASFFRAQGWYNVFMHLATVTEVNPKKVARPNGIAAFGAGTPDVDDVIPTIRPAGFETLTVPAAYLNPVTQYVYVHEICPYRMRSPTRVFEAFDQNAGNPSGNPGAGRFDAAKYGSATVELKNRELLLSGLNATKWGSALVAPAVRYLDADGFDAVKHNNSHRLSETPLHVYGIGFDPLLMGNFAQVSHFDPNVYPDGWDSMAVGSPRAFLWRYLQTIEHIAGDAGGTFGNFNSVYNSDYYLQAFGFAFTSFGTADLVEVNYTRSVAPAAIIPEVNDGHVVELFVRYIEPASIISETFTDYHAVHIDDSFILRPTGMAPPNLGTARIDWLQLFIQPEPIEPEIIDGPLVAFGVRRINPESFTATEYGRPELSRDIEQLFPSGIRSFDDGVPFVAYAERQLFAAGRYMTFVGYPVVGFDVVIDVPGTDYMAMGNVQVLDNTQRPYPIGFDALSFGVGRASTNPQSAYPYGIPELTQEQRWGNQNVRNNRRYVYPYYEPSGYDWAFGTFVTIENRNRTIQAYGFDMSKVPTGTFIELEDLGFSAGGIDFARYGNAMVADSIRYLVTAGDDSLAISNWNAIYNNARLLAPAGLSADQYGVPSIESNRRFLPPVGLEETTLWGDTFIAYRIRTVFQATPPAEYWIDYPTNPSIRLEYRRVFPNGIPNTEVGAAAVYEVFIHLYPHSILAPAAMGEARIYNKTPQLFTFGYELSLFGTTAVRLQYRTVQTIGAQHSAIGAHVIADTDRAVFPVGFSGLRHGVQEIRKQQPDPPGQQLVFPVQFPIPEAPDTIGPDWFGTPKLRFNLARPSGWDSLKTGIAHKVYGNSIYPQSIIPDPDRFGRATLPGAQFVYPVWEEDTFFGNFRTNPHRIWAPYGDQIRGSPNWVEGERIATAYNGNGQRLQVSAPRVDHRHRALQVHNPQSELSFGETKIDNKQRRVYVDGMKFYKPGFPVLGPTNRELKPFGWDAFEFGYSPALHIEGGINPIAAVGTKFDAFGNEADVSNFIRNVYPVGLYAFISPLGAQYIGPRIPVPIQGVSQTLWGTAFISHRIRNVYPEPFDAFTEGYEVGYFKDRMRVRQRGYIRPQSINQSAAGEPFIANRTRQIGPYGEPQWTVPVPELRKQNVITIIPGMDANAFGDVDRWEAGKVKPHGDQMDLHGIGRINRRLYAAGIGAQGLGSASISHSFAAYGIAPLDIPAPAVTGDGCGLRVVPPASISGTAFGQATIQ